MLDYLGLHSGAKALTCLGASILASTQQSLPTTLRSLQLTSDYGSCGGRSQGRKPVSHFTLLCILAADFMFQRRSR